MPAKPTVKTEVVSIADLGEVTVRGLMLSEFLELRRIGDTDPAHAPAETLALCVEVADDAGNRWTAQDWDIFGGQHPEAINDLMDVVTRLRTGSDAKQDEAPS